MSDACKPVQEADIPDPCVNVCRMDPAARYCQGCRRTLREIGLWSQMTREQKACAIEEIARRTAGW
ncbi:DUF1289 domain-containing protein [Burkholderia diffusa]|uniref:DUF1289 domain-containing protein n=1 Tax=Burkholderia diffusa TaxID=488732 RepID=UPI0007563DD9|nr:DUF1289 domain-containing protein [Burkholderia diffusa]KVG31099.1 hypothetical protein WJ30_15975 [Burkholderia diffusa]